MQGWWTDWSREESFCELGDFPCGDPFGPSTAPDEGIFFDVTVLNMLNNFAKYDRSFGLSKESEKPDWFFLFLFSHLPDPVCGNSSDDGTFFFMWWLIWLQKVVR